MRNLCDRLFERAKLYRNNHIGVGLEDISRMPLTTDLVTDIFACLRSDDILDLKTGEWFALGILDSNPPQELLLFIVNQLPKWLSHPHDEVRENAIALLIRLRGSFKNYRSLMLNALRDTSPDVRSRALAAYSTFLTPKDIPVLLPFENDLFMSETSMYSPLIYPIRNQAWQ